MGAVESSTHRSPWRSKATAPVLRRLSSAQRVGHQSPVGVVGVVESLHAVVAYGGHAVTPEGDDGLVGVAGIDGGVHQVVHAAQQAVALVEDRPMASRGREQVGVDVGAGIGFGVATGAEHHAIVEGAQAEAAVIGEGAVGTKGLVRAVGEECQQAFPAVSHPEGAVVSADGVEGLQGTPGEGAVAEVRVRRVVVQAHAIGTRPAGRLEPATNATRHSSARGSPWNRCA